MHASRAVDEARYPSRGPHWHGPHSHRVMRRVGNLSVVGTRSVTVEPHDFSRGRMSDRGRSGRSVIAIRVGDVLSVAES